VTWSTATAKAVNGQSSVRQFKSRQRMTYHQYVSEKWATVLNTVQPTNKIGKLLFPPGNIASVVNLVIFQIKINIPFIAECAVGDGQN